MRPKKKTPDQRGLLLKERPVSWERTILGRPGEHLGRWRWPIGAVGGVAIAIVAALTGEWTWAVVAGALAVISALLTVRSFR